MAPRIVFGILLGATVGFAIGYFGSRSGGTCPITCNPYGGAIYGAILGALIAGMWGRRTASYNVSSHLISVESEEAFEREVMQADGLVLVEFYTPGCRHCRRLEPVIHALADQFAGRALVAKVNAAELPEVARRHGIEGVPTLLLFKDGLEVDRAVGHRSEEALAALLERHVAAKSRAGTSVPREEEHDPHPDD